MRVNASTLAFSSFPPPSLSLSISLFRRIVEESRSNVCMTMGGGLVKESNGHSRNARSMRKSRYRNDDIRRNVLWNIWNFYFQEFVYCLFTSQEKRNHLCLFLIHFGLKIYYLIDRSTIISRIKIYQFMFEQQMIKMIVTLLKINRFDRCVTRLNAKEKKN